MVCLDENLAVELLEQRLPEAASAAVHEHLDGCASCRDLLAAAAVMLDESTTEPQPPRSQPTRQVAVEAPLDSSSESQQYQSGARIDHYQIVRLLGRGGMGEVYLAQDTVLERKVALKLLRGDFTKEGGAEQFLTEARATAMLSHPNIVAVHAIGQHRGRPYLALEHLAGRTLRERMAEGPLGVDESVRIASAVADALGAAHAVGVFHRDLTPRNVMLCVDGRARVLDFGLAKIADPDDGALTWLRDRPRNHEDEGHSMALDSSIAGGTPSYMAPEQWRAEACTGATDVWALGMMLYEMCAGRRPFDVKRKGIGYLGQLVELRATITGPEPAPPLEDAPAPLVELCARCLEKDAGARPTAGEVARTLGVVSAVRAMPATRTRATALILPALAAGAVVAAGAYLALRDRGAAAEPPAAPISAVAAPAPSAPAPSTASPEVAPPATAVSVPSVPRAAPPPKPIATPRDPASYR